MKYLYICMLCCFISCATEPKPIDICYPDKGIKTAKSYSENDPENYYLIHYDEEGHPKKETLTRMKRTYEHAYKNDTLLYTIITNLDRGQYYDEKPDSDYIDTLFVTKFEKDPRKYVYVEMESKSGFRTEFTSVDCRKESLVMRMRKDKIQDIDVLKEDGHILKITTFFNDQEKTFMVTYFTDYVFNNRGHWIERTEKSENGSSSREFRELTYY